MNKTPWATGCALAALAGGCFSTDEATIRRHALAVYAREAQPAPGAIGHPGAGPWERVPDDQVLAQCHLDPAALARADAAIKQPWVAIRYGRLCHANAAAEVMAPEESFSATKILGAVTSGAVAYQTRDLTRSGRKTGPFSDLDRVDHWLDHVAYNADAHVAHVLGMVAQSSDIAYGKRVMEYDYTGFVQLDSLDVMLTTAIAQDPARLGRDLDVFTQEQLFDVLGMTQSTWSFGLPNKSFGFGWNTVVLDMARLGQLILRGGVVNDQRVVDARWIYDLTHPAFEDANTAMGYCTWLNAADNFTTGTMPTPPDQDWSDLTAQRRFPGPCAPVAIHREHPHGLSGSPDCGYAAHSCEQPFDVGVWQSIAGFGSVIQGHPGLDLVLVGWQLTPEDFFGLGASSLLWDTVRPAIIAADPTYPNDEKAFCTAYGQNHYAPDLNPPH
ncbi:MAG: hypothetical protein ABW321_19505 [Polyangiales bacterium]